MPLTATSPSSRISRRILRTWLSNGMGWSKVIFRRDLSYSVKIVNIQYQLTIYMHYSIIWVQIQI